MKLNFLNLVSEGRLRNKFVLFFIILSVGPVLVLGYTSLYLVDLSHRYDISNLETQFIEQKNQEIKKFFMATLGLLELQVSTDKKYIDVADQSFILTQLLAENAAFEEVSFIEPKRGRETEKKNRYGKEIYLQDFSSLDKYKIPVSGKNYTGPVYRTLSGPMITLSAPVKNKNGEIIQILSAETNLSAIMKSVENARLGLAGYLILLDQTGSMIASGGGLGETFPGMNLSPRERVKKILSGKVFDALAEDDRYESLVSASVPVVGAGKIIPETGWVIMAEWPLLDADNVIHQVKRQVIWLTLFSVLMVLALVPFFSSRLLKPIKKLIKGTESIEAGNFDEQVAVGTGDELQDLGESFNRMAKGLKRLEELKNEFVFIAAHELRSPVTVIKGYLSMILESKPKKFKDVEEHLVKINNANQRLGQLVNDLLEVARSEAGKITVDVAPLDIRETIKSVADELKPLADEKSISLSYNIPKEMPLVLGADDRLKEILVNLAGNAIKYTQNGGAVRIAHEIKKDEIITTVSDNGFGISQESQKKLFEKFYRVKTEKTERIQGTGLGLFIVKELIQKMNGKIWVESEEGKGSVFSFSLPTAKNSS